jgi:hypothetical protein
VTLEVHRPHKCREEERDIFADCFLFILLGTTGSLQVIAARSGFNGLSFFGNRLARYVFGVVAIIAAYCWFFLTDRHATPHRTAEMGEQFAALMAGVFAGILITYLVSSLINLRMPQYRGRAAGKDEGIEALKNATFLQVVRNRLHQRSGSQ